MTRSKRPIRRRKPARARTVPVQVYVSTKEHRELAAIASKRGTTVSALVRAWIKRATAAASGRAPKPRAEDPRQLKLA